jgi:hypothetical protein
MAQVRVRMEEIDGVWQVNLPTYTIVPGSEDYNTGQCVVEVPDDELGEDRGETVVDKAKLRRKYRGQGKWDRDSYEPPDRAIGAVI